MFVCSKENLFSFFSTAELQSSVMNNLWGSRTMKWKLLLSPLQTRPVTPQAQRSAPRTRILGEDLKIWSVRLQWKFAQGHIEIPLLTDTHRCLNVLKDKFGCSLTHPQGDSRLRRGLETPATVVLSHTDRDVSWLRCAALPRVVAHLLWILLAWQTQSLRRSFRLLQIVKWALVICETRPSDKIHTILRILNTTLVCCGERNLLHLNYTYSYKEGVDVDRQERRWESKLFRALQ